MSSVFTFEEELELELELAQLAEEERNRKSGASAILWTPDPLNKPQQAAYDSKADVLGFGGSAGGGKSDLILGLAFTRHRVSKIFRREAAQLTDLIERAREIVGELMNLKGTCRLTDGRRISLLGVKDEDDVNKHKGRPADFFAFDEVTEFLEAQVRFLLGWLRSSTPNQRCRALLCFNPPTTVEGRWVLSFFGPWLDEKHKNPAQPGELRWFATLIGGEEIEVDSGEPFMHKGELVRPMSRSFIPSRLSDNSYLSNTNYWAVLQSLKEPLRSQLLYGDFKAGIADDPWQLIPTEWIKLAQKRWLDMGGLPEPGSRLDAIGVDVSRGGKDKTVVSRRYGRFYAALERFQGEATDNGQKVATLVTRSVYQYGPPRVQPDINIDATGVGSSPYDFLIASNLMVNAIYNGEKADEGATDRTKRLKFRNKRAQIYWQFMEALHPEHGDNLALPPDQQLLGDLSAVHWQLTPQGVLIEDKKEIEKRIGRSPDDGDAVVNAYIVPPPPVGAPASGGRRQTTGFRMA